jgi:hypothetical protein
MAETIKVADLLPERIDGMGTAVREALCNDAKVAGQQLAWGYISAHLEQALRKALDCDLFEVLAGGWAQSPLLSSYAAAMTKPTAEITLGAHQLTRELHPGVAVTIAPCPCPCIELEFTLALSARFSGLKLDIANRHITGGVPGEISASAELSFQNITLHEANSRTIELPGRFRFSDPGIPIGPAV